MSRQGCGRCLVCAFPPVSWPARGNEPPVSSPSAVDLIPDPGDEHRGRPRQIPAAIRTLVDDAKASVEYSTHHPDELAVRFHHRLDAIHPFPDGNGRHGRIAADHLVTSLGRKPFGWGVGLAVDTGELRKAYRQALQHAGNGEIAELLACARR